MSRQDKYGQVVKTYWLPDRFAEAMRLEYILSEMKRRKESDLTKVLKAALAIAVPSYGLQKLLEAYNRREFLRRERYRVPVTIINTPMPSYMKPRLLSEEDFKKIEWLRGLSEDFARERSKERRAALKRQIEKEMKALLIREERSFHRRARSSSREREISLVR